MREYRSILHKGAVREARISIQPDQSQTTQFQGATVDLVLFQGLGVIRLSQIGSR